jgi:glycine/D-amino acid oxidase-like deaminating enzyme
LKTDFLVVGQGISGTWLSYFLEKEGVDHVVVDDGYTGSASRLAGGLINPVTGRHKVKTWMADELLPFCWENYQNMGQLVKETVIEQKDIIECFSTTEATQLFARRVQENPMYLSSVDPTSPTAACFQNVAGYGRIHPAYLVKLDLLLRKWRERLQQKNRLLEKRFDASLLQQTSTGFQWENLQCNYIIFCEGIGLQQRLPSTAIPFAPTKGEALIVSIPDLPTQAIYKNKLTLLPLPEKGHWWVGSSVEWAFENALPSHTFKTQTLQALTQWLQIPFALVEQRSALRLGTMERRPLVGMDLTKPNMGYLNAMGTKGCSLAPFFAKQLVRHILFKESIHSEANWARFT